MKKRDFEVKAKHRCRLYCKKVGYIMLKTKLDVLVNPLHTVYMYFYTLCIYTSVTSLLVSINFLFICVVCLCFVYAVIFKPALYDMGIAFLTGAPADRAMPIWLQLPLAVTLAFQSWVLFIAHMLFILPSHPRVCVRVAKHGEGHYSHAGPHFKNQNEMKLEKYGSC